MAIITELKKTGIIVEETFLTIKSDTEDSDQTIDLDKIKIMHLDFETRYFIWFWSILTLILVFLLVLAANLHVIITWVLVVFIGVYGLNLMLGPPSRKFVMIDLKDGNQLKIPMLDSKKRYFEFLDKAHRQIHKPAKSG